MKATERTSARPKRGYDLYWRGLPWEAIAARVGYGCTESARNSVHVWRRARGLPLRAAR